MTTGTVKITAKDVYANVLSLLGYTDNSNFQRKAVPIFNKVYFELHRIVYGAERFVPISALQDELNLPEAVLLSVMPSGIAEMLALGEGDGEQQQYFALDYDRGKARLNREDRIYDVMP